MKLKKIFIIIIIISLFGCKESINDLDNVWKGEISFGIEKEVSIEQLINVFEKIGDYDNFDLHIQKYSNKYSKDEKNLIETKLSNIQFIEKKFTHIVYNEISSKWEIDFKLKNFSKSNLPQWNELKNDLEFEHSNEAPMIGVLKFQEGREAYWYYNLKQSGYFEWVDYNHIFSGS